MTMKRLCDYKAGEQPAADRIKKSGDVESALNFLRGMLNDAEGRRDPEWCDIIRRKIAYLEGKEIPK